MIQAILCGSSGNMGKKVTARAQTSGAVRITAGVDAHPGAAPFPVYRDFGQVKEPADVIIDFSIPDSLDSLLRFALAKKIPAVIATTGYSEAQIRSIRAAAKEIPVFFTFNMSLGVNLICSLSKKAAAVLGGDFDVEIIEKHHNQKIDAPSGTALMLASAVNDVFGDSYHYEYDRHSKRAKRPKNEIGIHSVRGGTIVGEHDVIFAGQDEVITLSHSAASKDVFATGALRAAEFLAKQPPGLYDMNSMMRFD